MLLTLLVTIILAVVVLEFNYLIRVHATLSGHLVDDLRLQTAAEAGVQRAMALLLNDALADAESETPFDALDEEWAEEIVLGADTSETTIRITDETSKLNLNRLVRKTDIELGVEETNPDMVENVMRLFEALEIDPNLVDEIVDWIDMNDEEEPFGAESSYYETLDPPIRCKNGPLDSVEELLLMEGFDEEILYGSEDNPGLIEFVTVCGDAEGRVNINTAPEEVLAAVLNSESMASMIAGEREMDPFESANDMTTRFPAVKLTKKFNTHASFFLVTSRAAYFPGGRDAAEEPAGRVEFKTLLKRVREEGEDPRGARGIQGGQEEFFSIDTVWWKVNRWE